MLPTEKVKSINNGALYTDKSIVFIKANEEELGGEEEEEVRWRRRG